MLNPIKAVYAFNKDAGLLETGYSAKRESTLQLEEALESFDLKHIYSLLNIDPAVGIPKDAARTLMAYVPSTTISEVDSLDKSVDAFVLAVGAMAKQGLSPQQIAEAVLIVNKYNRKKIKEGIDSYGKLEKPDTFIGPESELQELLNKRSTLCVRS